ncbi:hypothetical protein ABZ801_09955 [Actinomadura sp. NPDC047616]|uniref:RapZ C-terminal domain-containing protein n=1 Tax=Actinomadura sp. NPDC047616 TaxID=3155914 RepID=UPI0033CCB1DA
MTLGLNDVTVYARSTTVTAIAVGCLQGHDRSVAAAELPAQRVQQFGRTVVLKHRHVHLPRIRG